ncbi:phage recombination protein Bet [Ramlibacter henchirensis]|uniref:Phage recombination protein Bet n=1 Tax=Ramlibacter henchirensis TaxID=204072 RepID=A0A4Z0BYK2_9BURK|nr:phage recombination protein Bet [Ramlibacter henchirensis]TFZ03095.1 phage recombination protein Bet [Ramlibacter henchirensis]
MNANTETSELHGLEDEQLLDVLQASVYPTCERYMLTQIVRYCRAAGLDPTLRPVHVVSLRDGQGGVDGTAIVPGIGTYRSIAARCGCAGIDEPQFGPEVTEQFGSYRVAYPSWCRVTVRRRLAAGEVAVFTAREFWTENVAFEADAEAGAAVPNEVWRRRPFGQLAKCAEAQALRRGFPEVGAQPVLEELTGNLLEPIGQAAAGGAQRGKSSARPRVAMPQPRGPRGAARDGEHLGSQASLVLEPDAGQSTAPSAPGPRKRPEPPRGSDNQPRSRDDAPRSTGTAPHAGTTAPPAAPLAEPVRTGAASENMQALGDFDASESLETSEKDSQESPVAQLPTAAAAAPASVEACAAVASGRLQGGPPGDGDERAITAGERACLQRRLQAKGWSIAAARQAAGLEPADALDDLTRRGVAALMAVTA